MRAIGSSTSCVRESSRVGCMCSRWTDSHGRHAFPNLCQQAHVVYRALDELHILRNRIVHHEPIHNRDLKVAMLTTCWLFDWIEAEAEAEADADVRIWASPSCMSPSNEGNVGRSIRGGPRETGPPA